MTAASISAWPDFEHVTVIDALGMLRNPNRPPPAVDGDRESAHYADGAAHALAGC